MPYPRNSYSRRLTLGIVAAILLCALSAALAQLADPNEKAPDPHWNRDGCKQCHTINGKDVQPIPPEKFDALCLRCHNGKLASAEAHPIGRTIPKNGMDLPPKWPLFSGRTGCITCHDVKAACKVGLDRSLDNSAMLRSVEGSSEQANFCHACHRPEQLPRLNPHLMLTADRKPIESQCIICHKQQPDPSTAIRTGQPNLRADQTLLCKACHPKHRDPYEQGHLGTRLSEDKLAFMRARELVGLTAAPSKELLTQLKSAGATPTLMLPAKDGRITCSTCHNPHQTGLFPPGTSLGHRPMLIVNKKVISPVHGENWCNHCHDLN